jgi:hypothetical protein
MIKPGKYLILKYRCPSAVLNARFASITRRNIYVRRKQINVAIISNFYLRPILNLLIKS